ncbi:TetR/AcrR family transcriptional regulator [Mycobacterium deserti]|uniref:TetR/AcrR family transcriptional regulator n=1 Tax=Mycobacterium deserti TaxID=2978347 RepID=A0ABT2M656_9MYCO|nr:TetR/AcrR family transcriptional regulator [Mycobacterium deserti]MCT7657114.1 TetR/AcrR family transcriptional regulator [Mycobacterium deserti]
MTKGPKARRGHARTALVDAARARFQEVGFAKATTLEIATRAEVSETLIFRYFGSKTGLFVEAVLTPMAAFVEDLVRSWDAGTLPGESSIQETIGRYIDDLSAALPDRSALARAGVEAVVTHGDSPEIAVFRTRLASLFDELAVDMGAYLGEHGLRDADPHLIVRIGFLAVGAVAALLPLTYPDGHEPPTQREVKAELTDFILFGLQSRRA